MVEGQLQISEEYIGNEPTGVEAEPREDGEHASPQRPWNPSDIRVAARNFWLRNIVDMVDNKDLELVPDFQRNEVWGPVQRSRLIGSVLLQIPLPAFYFVEDSDLAFQVVDGLQRLSIVYQFIRGPRPLALSGLEYLDTLNGMRFEDLEASLRRRIQNSQIMVNVIGPTTPDEVKYNIYKRINTGGSPLNLQEIRHSMSKKRSREFIKSLTKLDEFQDAVDGTKLAVRMASRELVLRFCAFQFLPPEKYRDHGGIDLLLDRMTKALDDPTRIRGLIAPCRLWCPRDDAGSGEPRRSPTCAAASSSNGGSSADRKLSASYKSVIRIPTFCALVTSVAVCPRATHRGRNCLSTRRVTRSLGSPHLGHRYRPDAFGQR